MIYRLSKLSYGYDALEPHIRSDILREHHQEHHGRYVRRLNDLFRACPRLSGVALEEILADISKVPQAHRQAFRNYAGAHLNHSLLWRILAPRRSGPGGQDRSAGPTGVAAHAIRSAFETPKKLRARIADAAEGRFGSGWVWMAMDDRGELEVLSTPNEDSPIMLGYHPILGVDLWEHAYYRQFGPRRDLYLDAIWKVLNWDRIAELYDHCMDLTSRNSAGRNRR